jgi:tripartite-type tricarboxylate transporter receptor subunit TctC
VRPLCVLDGAKLDYPAKVTSTQSWSDLPTCMSFGIPVQYLMMRGIFMGPGASAEQVAYYTQVLDRVRELPEWRAFMAQGAFKASVMSGAPFVSWLDRTESFHRVLMREAKLMHGTASPVLPTSSAPGTTKTLAAR